MSRACSSCPRKLRRGSARRVWIMTPDGIELGIVCKRCALRAIAVLVPPPATVAPLCACCKRGRASVCVACMERLEQQVRELAAANVLLAARREGP